MEFTEKELQIIQDALEGLLIGIGIDAMMYGDDKEKIVAPEKIMEMIEKIGFEPAKLNVMKKILEAGGDDV